MCIVNKLILRYFAWFVYTFVNYKCNVLLNRNDKCLMPFRTFVTLSRFDKGKENRIVRSKWPRNPMLNFGATL